MSLTIGLRVVLGAALLLALAVMTPGIARAERVALVVGNSAYAHTQSLPNPRNDAEAMSDALRGLGFSVYDGYDLTRSGFEDLIRDFARGARTADAAVFFYAGHGLEVASVNYLVPVDAMIRDEADLQFETVKLTDVMAIMERQQRTNLIFLDACRDNPMTRNLTLSMGTRSVAVGSGLARVETGVGTLIAYATQPGNVALDGEGRHSPFTDALLTHIGTPGLDVEIMMRDVRRDVIARTNGQQVPWSSSSLTGSFAFQTAPTPVVAPAPPKSAADGGQGAADPEPQSSRQRETAAPQTEKAEAPPAVTAPSEGQGALPAQAEVALLTPETGGPVLPEAAEPTSAPPVVGLSGQALARQAQAELNRLGCDVGTEDGIWGRRSRSGLALLAEHAPQIDLAGLEPTPALLKQMAALDGRICPLVCAATETIVDGVCLRKTCPSGQQLSSAGSCQTPKAAAAPRTPSRKTGRARSTCFSYNGQTFCD